MNEKIKILKNFILDKNKKHYFQMTFEVFNLWKQDRKFPTYYFTRLAYKKDSPNYKFFTSFDLYNKLRDVSTGLHSNTTIEILENKVKFNNFCVSNNIPVPLMLGYNNERDFFIGNRKISIDDKEMFQVLLKNIIENNNNKDIFLKPVFGIKGKGCYRVSNEDLDKNIKMEKLFSIITKSTYIIQETLIQHPNIAKINPYSINTIRMDTYIKEDSTVEILSGVMRFGRRGNIVDNASSGGFFIALDLEQHKLKEYGFQHLSQGNKYIYEHPDTKVKLEGYEIPYVEETKELIRKIAKILGDRLVGWDIAITPNGPVIIEGNYNYGIRMQDIAYGGYKSHPVFNEILKNHL